MTIILFIVGFTVLIKGSDILIKGAVSLARFMQIAPWVVGLTVVGIGTSIPEFSIAFLANLKGGAPISFGTIAGSNTFNLLFIAGVAAIVSPLAVKRSWVANLIMNAAAVATMLVIGQGGITRLEGALLLIFFIAWLYWTAHSEKLHHSEIIAPEFTLPVSAAFILAGLAGVLIGAQWVLQGVVFFAKALGASEELVSLTLISLGTSLPELAVSIAAARKNNAAMAIGNIIGSNIFDFWGIVGISALAKPIIAADILTSDLLVTAGAALLLFAFAYIGRINIITRKQGVIMVLAYLVYIAFIIARG